MHSIVLFVEGQGDVQAMPAFVGRWLAEQPAELQSIAYIDQNPYRIGGIQNITGRRAPDWTRWLEAVVVEKENLGGVLLAIDADDIEHSGGCVRDTARELATSAMTVGAGSLFSLAVTFFRQEFESMIIACHERLPNFALRSNERLPSNPEEAPRGAKRWLNINVKGGYTPTQNQAVFSRHINFEQLRQGNFRSFRRFENAMRQILNAISTGQHVSTPRLLDTSGG